MSVSQTKKSTKSSKIVLNRLEPREVQVRVIFLRVGDIDTLNEKFFAEILVESKWEEPRLSTEFDCSLIYNEEKELNNAHNYWNPKVYIENALNDPKQTVHYKIKKEIFEIKDHNNNENNDDLNPAGNVRFKFWLYEYKKVRGYFFEKLELNYFPVDVQDLSIIVTTFRSNKEHVEVKRKYDHEEFDELLDSSEKNEKNNNLKLRSSIRFPMIMFQCRAARRSGYFYWNAFFLIFLITSAVFTTFSIDFDKPFFRLPTTATLLLTSITFRWSYSSRCLPTVNYLTSLDKYSISSLFLIYLCLIWHGACNLIFVNLPFKTVRQLDRIFLIFLILLYLAKHAILIIWLRSAYSIRKMMKEKDSKLFKSENKSTESLASNDTSTIEDDNQRPGAPSLAKRNSVFSTINNIDEINSRRKKSVMRRFSSQFKGVLSNLSINISTNTLNEREENSQV